MIKFVTEKDLIAIDKSVGSYEFDTHKIMDQIIYLDYNKGSEDTVTLQYEVYDSTFNVWYPVNICVNDTIVPYINTITNSGKYRLILPVGSNEEKFRVTVTFTGSQPYGTISVIVISGSREF